MEISTAIGFARLVTNDTKSKSVNSIGFGERVSSSASIVLWKV
ncbi:hypothetical protein LA76x_3345 [Lysobacter antibioticus]|uniref:Uncharacterized protein n=1 Tax=Lysobacter antibioticus TaxID=84531 RepID=A0A0S2FD36_LYSAN|nr:hypothetical protein LA76x_3345 [Lysobacter antibioticus]